MSIAVFGPYFERSTARRDPRVDPSRHPPRARARARESALFYNNVVFCGAMKRHFYRRFHPRHYSPIKIVPTRPKFIGSKFNLHDRDY